MHKNTMSCIGEHFQKYIREDSGIGEHFQKYIRELAEHLQAYIYL